jgi:hypothetical protein
VGANWVHDRRVGPGSSCGSGHLTLPEDEQGQRELEADEDVLEGFGGPHVEHRHESRDPAEEDASREADDEEAALLDPGDRVPDEHDGEFVRHDPGDAALAGWSLVHGAATLVAAGQLVPIDDQGRPVSDRLVAVLLDGLRHPDGAPGRRPDP